MTLSKAKKQLPFYKQLHTSMSLTDYTCTTTEEKLHSLYKRHSGYKMLVDLHFKQTELESKLLQKKKLLITNKVL